MEMNSKNTKTKHRSKTQTKTSTDKHNANTTHTTSTATRCTNTRRDRPILLLACCPLAFENVSGRREQCGSARPFCAVALHPQTGEDVPDQRPMARYRKQRNA